MSPGLSPAPVVHTPPSPRAAPSPPPLSRLLPTTWPPSSLPAVRVGAAAGAAPGLRAGRLGAVAAAGGRTGSHLARADDLACVVDRRCGTTGSARQRAEVDDHEL